MRLLTQINLICVVKGCEKTYPLELIATKVDQEESELNVAFLLNILNRIDYNILRETAIKVFNIQDLPAELPPKDTLENDSDLLTKLQKLLLDTHVIEGSLVCSGCKRVYPINSGIPNMKLSEEEV